LKNASSKQLRHTAAVNVEIPTPLVWLRTIGGVFGGMLQTGCTFEMKIQVIIALNGPSRVAHVLRMELREFFSLAADLVYVVVLLP
jgi:hypothetical protein